MKMKDSTSLHRDRTFRRWWYRERTNVSVIVCLAFVALGIPIVAAFVPSAHSFTDSIRYFGVHDEDLRKNSCSRVAFSNSIGPTGRSNRRPSTTRLHFMGSDGGILGIGTPELVRYV
jgi:hypothetical protein